MEVKTSREALEMEELLYQLLWSQLQSLGLFREKHAILTNQRELAGISASYDRWLQESVAFLERQQYLHSQDNICTVPDPTLIESATLWQRWDQHKERWMQNADLKAQVELVEITLRALPTILTGKQPATEILFPNGSMHLVEGIYQHNVIADYYNEVLAQLLATYLQERLTHERHTRIRILEIGAGTGATTSKVLRMVQPYQASIAEYCYSDISEAFLRYGLQTYGVAAYPFLTYRLLNVEQSLTGQGIELGSYDVVIAANVLHATSNIRRTVCNVKAVLKKHGLLLLNEITGTSLFAHLTFGLLSGWWVYEDPELRVPGCPALSVENWQEVLGSEGFGAIYLPTQDVTCVPCATARLASQETGQQIIVAESDGVVRQLRHLYPEVEAAKGPVLPRTVPTQPVMIRSGKSGSIVDNTDEALRKKSIAYLKGQVGKVLNLPSTKIDANEPLTSYGLDSILVLQLTKTLRTGMEQISSTLFFEYATIDALVEHFLHTQREALEHLVGFSRPANPDHPPTARRLLTLQYPPTDRGNEENQTRSPLVVSPPPTPSVDNSNRATPNMSSSHRACRFAIERDIAIIGLTGRYPGAKDVQTFWDLLSAGKSGIREIPASRWDWRHYFQAEKGSGASPGQAQGTVPTMYTKWGGFLENIESFDASFFHISPREAEQMDPQECLFLEVSYTCIEDAGYTPIPFR